jgi:hypothetical protein
MNTLTTKLEAINTMLATIGETPVSTLEDTGVVDVAIAKRVLHNVSRRVQVKAWEFNLEKSFTLTPTFPKKEIVLPANTLGVDSVGSDIGITVVQRGTRLYNNTDHTYIFDEALDVDLILFLDFEELPEAARDYITIKAARIFQQQTVGSLDLEAFSEREELMSLIVLKQFDGESADYSILTGTRSVANVLAR